MRRAIDEHGWDGAWSGFTLRYRWGLSVYAVVVLQAAGTVPPQDDGVEHKVVVQVPA